MFCPTCGTPAEAGAPFCGSCGAQLNAGANTGNAVTQPNEQVEKVKTFLKNNLLQITKSIFGKPTEGTYNIFANADEEAFSHSIILYLTTAILFSLLPYLFAGNYRDYLPFSYFLRIGISVFIILFLISILTFVVKAVTGKPDFKKELLTGAICGIPLIILLLLVSVIGLLVSNTPNIIQAINNPVSATDSGVLLLIVIIYVFLMLINIVQQSIKASGSSDAINWYLSPAIVSLAFYLGVRISIELFKQ